MQTTAPAYAYCYSVTIAHQILHSHSAAGAPPWTVCTHEALVHREKGLLE